MGNLTINNGGIITNSTNLPNIDLRYGPYNSIQSAYELLGDQITPGLVIGVREGGIVGVMKSISRQCCLHSNVINKTDSDVIKN